MLKVIINETYYVEVDNLNYTVVKNRIASAGAEKNKPVRKVVGYYPNMKLSLAAVAKDLIESKENQVMSLNDYKEMIEQTLDNYLKELDTIGDRVEVVIRNVSKKDKKSDT